MGGGGISHGFKNVFWTKICKFFFTSLCVCVCVLIKIKYFKTDQNFIKKKIPKNIENFFEKHFTMKKIKPYSTTKKKWQNLDALCRFLN